MGESVCTHHDECPELLGSREEGTEFRVGQFLAVDIGQDFDALQFQVLLRSRVRRTAGSGSCKVTTPSPTNRSGLRGAEYSATPSLARRCACSAILGSNRNNNTGVARCHDLDVDAHLVKIEQAAIDRVMTSPTSCCAFMSLAAVSQNAPANPAEVDMRLGRAWRPGAGTDMGVNVDRRGRWAPGEAICVVDACCSRP